MATVAIAARDRRSTQRHISMTGIAAYLALDHGGVIDADWFFGEFRFLELVALFSGKFLVHQDLLGGQSMALETSGRASVKTLVGKVAGDARRGFYGKVMRLFLAWNCAK